jgi:hypothetical protein
MDGWIAVQRADAARWIPPGALPWEPPRALQCRYPEIHGRLYMNGNFPRKLRYLFAYPFPGTARGAARRRRGPGARGNQGPTSRRATAVPVAIRALQKVPTRR